MIVPDQCEHRLHSFRSHHPPARGFNAKNGEYFVGNDQEQGISRVSDGVLAGPLPGLIAIAPDVLECHLGALPVLVGVVVVQWKGDQHQSQSGTDAEDLPDGGLRLLHYKCNKQGY